MDVDIAVSLMRGQMGTVVERAVSAAVETVLAEMLKVVGIKFEELKRDMAAKEKENETIRHMLEYSRCQVKTMRKYLSPAGTRENRLTSTYQRTAVSHAEPRRPHGPSAAEATLSSGRPGRNALSVASTTNGNPQQPCSRNRITHQPDTMVRATTSFHSHDLTSMVSQAMDDSLTAVSAVSKAPEQLEPLKEEHSNTPEAEDSGQLREEEEACESDWINQQPSKTPDPPLVLSPAKTDGAEGEDGNPRDPRPSPPQVKEEEAEVEVFSVKEEPEEVVVASLLLGCEDPAQENPVDWSGPSSLGQRTFTEHTALTTGSHCTYSLAPPTMSVSGGAPPRPLRPWPKDLSLYEEYKLRRAELRRRSQTRRREMEKTLPQPLLADLVRERREKTRLRVARWRAKRKLQACLLSQSAQMSSGPSQALGLNTQHKTTHTVPGHQRSSSHPQYGSFLYNRAHCDTGTNFALQFNSPSSLLLGHGHNMAEHVNQPAVTSSQSQQSLLVADSDIYQ